METFEYGLIAAIVTLIGVVIAVWYDLRNGGKVLTLAEGTLDKIEMSPMLDGLEWLGKEVVGVDVLRQFNEQTKNANQQTREMFLELRTALDTVTGLADRAFRIAERLTDGKPNDLPAHVTAPTEVHNPAELLQELQKTARQHGFDVKEVNSSV